MPKARKAPERGLFSGADIDMQRYRGMNPKFVRQVWAKRRAELPPGSPPPQRTKTIKQVLRERANMRAVAREQQRAERERLYVEEMKARAGDGTVAGILADAALAHGITVEAILGETRTPRVVQARHAAIVATALAFPGWSLSRIGRILKRDHTTILYVLQKHKIGPYAGEPAMGRTLRDAR